MRSIDFQAAYDHACSQFPKGTWVLLSPREQTDAIYAAMRTLDIEGLADTEQQATPERRAPVMT